MRFLITQFGSFFKNLQNNQNIISKVCFQFVYEFTLVLELLVIFTSLNGSFKQLLSMNMQLQHIKMKD